MGDVRGTWSEKENVSERKDARGLPLGSTRCPQRTRAPLRGMTRAASEGNRRRALLPVSRDRRRKGDPPQPPQRGEPKLYGVRDPRDLKQRHKQLLREVEMDRLARASRAARKSRAGAGWGSKLAWATRRAAGRLRKLLKMLRNAG